MTADIRTAAQREADRRLPGDFSSHLSQYRQGFVDGAVWAAERVTPTQEQIAERIARTMPGWNDDTEDGQLTELWERVNESCLVQGRAYADAVLALMQELAEGEKA